MDHPALQAGKINIIGICNLFNIFQATGQAATGHDPPTGETGNAIRRRPAAFQRHPARLPAKLRT
jgi:hypothetical protein